MHHYSITLQSPIPTSHGSQNPNPKLTHNHNHKTISPVKFTSRVHQIDVKTLRCCTSFSTATDRRNNNFDYRRRTDNVFVKDKDIDVATLGNLCVDIVLNVPELPPKSRDERKAYMDRLSASPPDKIRLETFALSHAGILDKFQTMSFDGQIRLETFALSHAMQSS